MSTNLNDTNPAPPAGYTNVKWATDGNGNDSACVPTSILTSANTFIASLVPGDVLVWNGSDWVNAIPPSGVLLENNGTPNTVQSLLNLIAGSNITLTDNGVGGITITSTGGTAPALVKLAEVITSGSVPTISFSGIPGTYRNLVLVLTGRTDDTNPDTYLQFNGDTGANYSYASGFQGSATGSATGFSVAKAICGSVAPSGAPSNQAAVSEFIIGDYARTVFLKSVHARIHRLDSGSAAYVLNNGLTWANTAAITSIVIGKQSGSGNFVVGTVASLYGQT